MKKIFSLALLTVFFVSCQKEPDLSDMDGEFTVLTNFDVNADMSTASTFYIPDSILLIGSDSENPTYWTGTNASNLVSEFVTNMEEFEKAFGEALSCGEPYLIDCIIDSDDKVWPMVAPGDSIDEAFTEEDLAAKE